MHFSASFVKQIFSFNFECKHMRLTTTFLRYYLTHKVPNGHYEVFLHLCTAQTEPTRSLRLGRFVTFSGASGICVSVCEVSGCVCENKINHVQLNTVLLC